MSWDKDHSLEAAIVAALLARDGVLDVDRDDGEPFVAYDPGPHAGWFQFMWGEEAVRRAVGHFAPALIEAEQNGMAEAARRTWAGLGPEQRTALWHEAWWGSPEAALVLAAIDPEDRQAELLLGAGASSDAGVSTTTALLRAGQSLTLDAAGNLVVPLAWMTVVEPEREAVRLLVWRATRYGATEVERFRGIWRALNDADRAVVWQLADQGHEPACLWLLMLAPEDRPAPAEVRQ